MVTVEIQIQLTNEYVQNFDDCFCIIISYEYKVTHELFKLANKTLRSQVLLHLFI